MAANCKSPPKDALVTPVLRRHLWVPGVIDEMLKQPEKTRDEWNHNQRIYG